MLLMQAPLSGACILHEQWEPLSSFMAMKPRKLLREEAESVWLQALREPKEKNGAGQ